MAVDGDAAALAALKAGADGASLNVQTMRRDLLRTPLAALEMRRFDAVIFDPPRAGARLQAAEIARSRIERVAAVSCDAATFARDARTLIDGGFTLARVSPVDQFRYTPHAEIVGAFVR
jgi:23S rRNA (uracil1939-C5)-methyltransferase